MQSVTLKSIMEGMSRRLGRHPDTSDGIETEQRMELVGYLQARLPEVWDWAWWPELMRCETRLVLNDATSGEDRIDFETAAWSAATTYAIGDVVERYGARYEAAAASTDKDPATEAAYWTAVTRTPIGAVKTVATNNPLASDYPEEWPFQPRTDGIVITDTSVGANVFVLFRIQCPELNGTLWDETITYAAGDVRYYDTTGDCYKCRRAPPAGTLPTDTTYWERIQLPAILRAALACLAAADALYSDDREGEADKMEGRGYDRLEIAQTIAIRQQRVTETAGVVNLE